MLRAEIPIANLSPIDEQVWAGPLALYGQIFVEKGALPDIRTIPLSDESPLHILLDGHHKARVAHDTGQAALFGTVYETDQEIAPFLREHRSWWDMSTIGEVQERYKAVWGPRALAPTRACRIYESSKWASWRQARLPSAGGIQKTAASSPSSPTGHAIINDDYA